MACDQIQKYRLKKKTSRMKLRVSSLAYFFNTKQEGGMLKKNNILGVPKSDFQNAAEAQKSLPKLSAVEPNFPMDMERLILVSLSEKRPNKNPRDRLVQV